MASSGPANGESSLVRSQFLREENETFATPIPPPLDLSSKREPEPVDLSTKQGFPGILGIPADIADNSVDRINLVSNCTDSKFIDMLCSKDLVKWGVITRPDGKLGFQFITKRKPKTPKKSPAKFKWTKDIATEVQATISMQNMTNPDMPLTNGGPSSLIPTTSSAPAIGE